jgi:hypothetical protein
VASYDVASNSNVCQALRALRREEPGARGLHSSIFQLNLSAFCGTGGAFGGFFLRVYGKVRGYEEVSRVHFVSETAQVELKSGTSVSPCPGRNREMVPRRRRRRRRRRRGASSCPRAGAGARGACRARGVSSAAGLPSGGAGDSERDKVSRCRRSVRQPVMSPISLIVNTSEHPRVLRPPSDTMTQPSPSNTPSHNLVAWAILRRW